MDNKKSQAIKEVLGSLRLDNIYVPKEILKNLLEEYLAKDLKESQVKHPNSANLTRRKEANYGANQR